MKSIKKLIMTISAAAMLAAAVAGCGPAKEADEIPTLTWYMPKSIENMSSQQLVEDEVNKIFEKEVGARIKLNLIDNASWVEKMNVVINSGEEFDLVFADWGNATSVRVNAEKGTYMDIKDLVEKYGQDIKAKADPRAWQFMTFNDQLLAVPSQGKYVTEIGWTFKKDLAEKYNFDYKSVKEPKDLEPYFDTLLANEPGIIPCLGISFPPPEKAYTDVVGIPGVMFDEEQEKYIKYYDIPEYREEARLKHEWYKKGYIPADALTLNNAETYRTGKVAVMKDAGAITEDGSKSSASYGFPCADIRVGVKNTVNGDTFRGGQAVSITSKHPEKAVQVLNLIWKDPYISNTLAYGIEDVDYVYESGKGTDNPTVIPKEGSERTWALWHNYIGPLFDQWDSSWNSTEALQKMQEMNNNLTISKQSTLVFDTSSIKAEIAALSEVRKASQKVFANGAMPDFDSYMAEYENKLADAGIDKVIDELNRQYREYKAAK
ncbi:MAG: DUF3502 domain-containing protein [Clostridia bacterium]|nr:DUF3502 domain-containing protein [Clostridia bacterium]